MNVEFKDLVTRPNFANVWQHIKFEQIDINNPTACGCLKRFLKLMTEEERTRFLRISTGSNTSTGREITVNLVKPESDSTRRATAHTCVWLRVKADQLDS